LLVAVGGGPGLNAALSAVKGRSESKERKSTTGTFPPPGRVPQVSFPDLNDELHQIRAEVRDLIDSVRDDCDRGREEVARRQDEQFRMLTEKVTQLTVHIHSALSAAAEREKVAERERQDQRTADRLRESRRGGPR